MATTLRDLRDQYCAYNCGTRKQAKELDAPQLASAIANARRNEHLKEQRAREQANKEAAEKAAREARIAERADADAWMAREFDYPSDDHRLQRIARLLKDNVEAENAAKDRFLKNLDADPRYALSWSKDYFLAVARGTVARELAAAIFENGVSLEDLLKVATSNAVRAARYPASSSSSTDNLMEACMGTAWAEVCDRYIF
jgi:hypothetical protein